MLQRIEGFDTFSETTTDPQDLLEKGLGYVPASSSFTYTAGQFAGNAIRMDAAADEVHIPFTVPVTEFYVGFWFRTSALPGSTTVIASVRPLDDSTIFHLTVSIDASGNVTLSNNGGSLGASSGSEISANTWHFIELGGTINDTTGTGTVKVDEVQLINVSAQDTLNGTTAEVGQLFLHGYASANVDFDDVYIVDATVVGTEPVTFVGYVTVATVFPSANGTTNNFTVSGAASNYQAVDDTSADDDTTYVVSSTATHKETYLMQAPDIGYNGSTVIAVTTTARVRKEGPGDKTVRMHISSDDGTSLDTGDTEGLSAEYRYLPPHKSFADPLTATPWEFSDLQSLYVLTEIVS